MFAISIYVYLHKFHLSILAPNGQQLYDSGEVPFPPMKRNGDNTPQQYEGILASVDVRNLPLKEEGIYIFEVAVNGDIVSKQEIPCFKREGDSHGKNFNNPASK